MLEKTFFNLQLVDDLKAGDPFSDDRFKDFVIYIQGTFISAFSNITLKCSAKKCLRTGLNEVMKIMTVLNLVHSCPNLGNQE